MIGAELIADDAFTARTLDLEGLASDLNNRLSDGNVDDEMQALLNGRGGRNLFTGNDTYSVTLNTYNELNTNITGITLGFPGATGNDITLAVNPFTTGRGEIFHQGTLYSLATDNLPISIPIVGHGTASYIGQRESPPAVVAGVTREETASAVTFNQSGTIASVWTAPVSTMISTGTDATLLNRTGTVVNIWTPPVVTMRDVAEDVTLINRTGSIRSIWTPPVSTTTTTPTVVDIFNRTGTITSSWTPPVTRTTSAQEDVTLFNRTGTITSSWTPPVTTTTTSGSDVTLFNRSGTSSGYLDAAHFIYIYYYDNCIQERWSTNRDLDAAGHYARYAK